MLVLQGGGPFVANDAIDRVVFADHARIVVLPTADAFENPAEMIESATAWGVRVGIDIDPLMVLTREHARAESAAATVSGASAVALVGDSPSHLRSVLKDTALWDEICAVHARGGVLLAVAASASALCDTMTDPRGGAFTVGLGLISGLALVTETETWTRERLERTRHLADVTVAELPTGSALVWRDAAWEHHGDITLHGDLPRLAI